MKFATGDVTEDDLDDLGVGLSTGVYRYHKGISIVVSSLIPGHWYLFGI
jgi:hypothetical protein